MPSLLLLFALLLSLPAAAQTPADTDSTHLRPTGPPATATAAELMKEGDRLHREKAFLDALDYFEAAARKGPETAILRNKIGFMKLLMGRYKEARKDFERAIKLDPNYVHAFNNLGAAFFYQRKYKKAIRHYEQGLKLRDDSALLHANLGMSLFAIRKYDQAAAQFARALELDPEIFERRGTNAVSAQMAPEDRARYSYELARMYARFGFFDRSLLYLRKAMEEGYKDIKKVYKENEFAELRKDPRFAELMAAPPPPLN